MSQKEQRKRFLEHIVDDHDLRHIEEFDAWYCFTCEVFIEDKCQDIQCIFCAKRPDKLPAEMVDK
jgi:hypothetical protein